MLLIMNRCYILNLSLTLIIFCLLNQFSYSQEIKNNKLNLGVGASFFAPAQLTYSSSPAFIISYERRINSDKCYFTAGVNVAHQQWLFYDPNQISINDTADQFVNRTSIGMRLLYNYRTSKKIKLYSGLRLSYHIWNLYDNHNNKVDLSEFSAQDGLWIMGFDLLFGLLGLKEIVPWHRSIIINKYGLQVIPIAANYSLGKNFDLNAELALLGPYYFSTGLSYKF